MKAKHGRKNLTFSNRAQANSLKSEIQFVLDTDSASFERHHSVCFFVQLALHELIGHGCGKLYQEYEPGVFNFDVDKMPVNPFTNEVVRTWYGVGETPEAAFSGVCTAYIECLAEGIGLYLMSVDGVLQTLVPSMDLETDDGKLFLYRKKMLGD